MNVLVTGATGYIGGRLIPALLSAGHEVRALVRRDASRLSGRPWSDRVDVAVGDVLDPNSLSAAMADIGVAYYLVHSMRDARDFSERDVVAARNFARAAEAAGLERIVYLGGLGDDEDGELSPHLRSRQKTGEALRSGSVPVTELQAAIVVGSGSVSFEIIRYLTERLPVMVCPRWVYTEAQPIAVDDVLAYLVAAPTSPESADKVIPIGGADVVTYGEMMKEYARQRGLRRFLVPVPVLTPRLSSYWVHLITPVPASIVRPLIEGLRNEVTVTDDSARRIFPGIRPVTYGEAVRRVLDEIPGGEGVATIWSDAQASSSGDVAPERLPRDDVIAAQGMISERRVRGVDAPPGEVLDVIKGLGGQTGWLYADWAWRLRGAVDFAVGGVGFRRGRRHPTDLRPGDAVDFWRVEAVEPDRRVRLRAEMKVPGRAWLEFETRPDSSDVTDARGTELVQTATFAPKGLAGLAYWYALYPIHAKIFSGLVDAIAERAEARHSG